MAFRSRSVGSRPSIASLATFLVVLIIEFSQLRDSAPFWQMLVIALVAGATGLAVGLVTQRRIRSRQ